MASDKARRLFYRLVKGLVSILFRFVWRLEINGRDNVPISGPVIIAANHRSYGDPPLIGVSIPREVHFLAKQELFDFKPFGWLISSLNAHPLNRKGGDIGAMKLAQKLLSGNHALIIFPEGKRMKTDEMGKPKNGVGLLAKMADCPVVPAYIHNSADIFKFKKLSVYFSEPVNPARFNSYEDLVPEIMRRIKALKDQVLERRAKTEPKSPKVNGG